MYSRYEQSRYDQPRYVDQRPDDRYAPAARRDYVRERSPLQQPRDRYYANGNPSTHDDRGRWPLPRSNRDSRQYDPAPPPRSAGYGRHAVAADPRDSGYGRYVAVDPRDSGYGRHVVADPRDYRQPSPQYVGSRRAYEEPAPPPARYERRPTAPRRYEAEPPPPQRSYDDRRGVAPSAYDNRRPPPRSAHKSNGYNTRHASPPLATSRAPQRDVSPIRGVLLPTTEKYIRQQERAAYSGAPPPRRSSPAAYAANRQYASDGPPSYKAAPSRRPPIVRRYDSGAPRGRSDRAPVEPPRRRAPIISLGHDVPISRPSRAGRRPLAARVRGAPRGRGVSSRGRPRRIEMSPIRAAGEYDDAQDGGKRVEPVEAAQDERRRESRSSSMRRSQRYTPSPSRSRSRSPIQPIDEATNKKPTNLQTNRAYTQREEEQLSAEDRAEMLDFEDEVDTQTMTQAAKLTPPQEEDTQNGGGSNRMLQLDPKDLHLKDAAEEDEE